MIENLQWIKTAQQVTAQTLCTNFPASFILDKYLCEMLDSSVPYANGTVLKSSSLPLQDRTLNRTQSLCFDWASLLVCHCLKRPNSFSDPLFLLTNIGQGGLGHQTWQIGVQYGWPRVLSKAWKIHGWSSIIKHWMHFFLYWCFKLLLDKCENTSRYYKIIYQNNPCWLKSIGIYLLIIITLKSCSCDTLMSISLYYVSLTNGYNS